MLEVFERRSFVRKIPKIPQEVLKRYEKWKDIVGISGLDGLRLIKGFHDEALRGKWNGYRSSRLGLHYRIIYKIEEKQLYVMVIDINPHDYKKR